MLMRNDDGSFCGGGSCGKFVTIVVEDSSHGMYYSCNGIGCEFCKLRFVCYTSKNTVWIDSSKFVNTPLIGKQLDMS